MSKPSHIAYIVKEMTKDGKKQSYWRAVGAVWPHKNGEGFDVVIHDQISVTGRITCIVPKADEADDRRDRIGRSSSGPAGQPARRGFFVSTFAARNPIARLVAALAPAQRAGVTAYAAISPRGILHCRKPGDRFSKEPAVISGDAPPT